MSTPDPPTVPESELESGGWEFVEESSETMARLPTARVRGTTRRYEDQQLRETLRAATDGGCDRTVRFFAATRVVFEPPPPPGISVSMAGPTLRTQARQAFADRLRERGLTDVERVSSQRVRTDDRSRARLTRFDALDRFDCRGEPVELALSCWVGVWTCSKTARVVTGGYPTSPVAEQLDLDSSTRAEPLVREGDSFREELLSLLRAVE